MICGVSTGCPMHNEMKDLGVVGSGKCLVFLRPTYFAQKRARGFKPVASQVLESGSKRLDTKGCSFSKLLYFRKFYLNNSGPE